MINTTLDSLLGQLYSRESKAVAVLAAIYQERNVDPLLLQQSIILFSNHHFPEAVELSFKTAFTPYVTPEDRYNLSSLAHEYGFSAKLALKAGDQQIAKALYQKAVAASKDIEADPNARLFTLQDSCRLAELFKDEAEFPNLVTLTSEALIDKLESSRGYNDKWTNELITWSQRIKDQNVVNKLHQNIISAVVSFNYKYGFEIAQQLGYTDKAEEIYQKAMSEYQQKGWYEQAAELAKLKGEKDLSVKLIKQEVEAFEREGKFGSAVNLSSILGDGEKTMDLKRKWLEQEEASFDEQSVNWSKFQNLIYLSQELGYSEKALQYLDRAIEFHEKANLPVWVAREAYQAELLAKQLGKEKESQVYQQKLVQHSQIAKERYGSKPARGIEEGMNLWKKYLNGNYLESCWIAKKNGSVPAFSEDTLNLARQSENKELVEHILDQYIDDYLKMGSIKIALQYDEERNNQQKSQELYTGLLKNFLEKKDVTGAIKKSAKKWSTQADLLEKEGNYEGALQDHEHWHRFNEAHRIATSMGDNKRAAVYQLAARFFHEKSYDPW